MNFQELKETIDSYVTTNREGKITGQELNWILKEMVTTIEEEVANIEPEPTPEPEPDKPTLNLKYYCFYGWEQEMPMYKRILDLGISAKIISESDIIGPPTICNDENIGLNPTMCCVATDDLYLASGTKANIYDIANVTEEDLNQFEITEDLYYTQSTQLSIDSTTTSASLGIIFEKIKKAYNIYDKVTIKHLNYYDLLINGQSLMNAEMYFDYYVSQDGRYSGDALYIDEYRIVQSGNSYVLVKEEYVPLKHSLYSSNNMPGYNYTTYPKDGDDVELYKFTDGTMLVRFVDDNGRATSDNPTKATIQVTFPGLPDDNGKNLLGTTKYDFVINKEESTVTIKDVLQGVYGEFGGPGQYADIVFKITNHGTQLELLTSEIIAKVYGNIYMYGENSPLIGSN